MNATIETKSKEIEKKTLTVDSSEQKRQKRLRRMKGLSFVDRRYVDLVDYSTNNERTITFEILHDSFVKKWRVGDASDLLDLVDYIPEFKLKNVKIFGEKKDGLYPVLVISEDSKIGLTVQSKIGNSQFETNEIYHLIMY